MCDFDRTVIAFTTGLSRLLDGLASSSVYVPLEQQFTSRITSTLTIAARTTHGQRIPGELRALVASIDPSLPLISSQTLEDAVSLGLVPQHVAVSVSASLGVVGLILAAIGIYGVTAFAVTRRTREIGIRIALGARRSNVLCLVVGRGASLTAIGCVIGLALGAAEGRMIASFLYGVSPIDPLIFAGAPTLFVIVGILACYVPARGALHISAIDALRYE